MIQTPPRWLAKLYIQLNVCAVLAFALTTPAQAQTKTVNTVQTPARVTTNGAPSLLIPPSSGGGPDLCLGEASGAYGSPMLAFTLTAAKRDQVCSLLRQSKWAADLSRPALSYQLMCASADWRRDDAKTERLCR